MQIGLEQAKGLRITHPEHGLLPTKLVGNTPVLGEAEALQLIADLEQLELELDKLEKNNTDGVLKMMSAEESQLTWLDHLKEFVQKGERASLRRMLLDEESPLDAVAEAEVVGLVGVDDRLLLSDEAGALYFRSPLPDLCPGKCNREGASTMFDPERLHVVLGHLRPYEDSLDLPRNHKMPAVDEEEDIEPELDPFEEEDKVDVPPEEEDEEQKALNERFKRIYKDIGDDIECQTLNFAAPMTSRTSKEVRGKIQHIYLQLRQHGLPLVRIHPDRGLELIAKEADRDILATTGESQQPQQNGRAEALVREIKRRVKVLLRTSGLPATCWPVAAEFVARRQRDLALGNYEDKDLAFGAPTHVKYKRFGESGRYDLLERWKEGLFVGYSNDVKGGRVVRHGDGAYTTSVHIRPYLVDSDELVQLGPHEALDANNDIDNLAKSLLDNNQFQPEHVVELWREGLQWLIGQYTYGSQCGNVNDTYLHPVATAYLVRAFKEMTGKEDFTALLLTENVDMKCHRDVHNNGARSNWLLPLQQCEEGGGVWMGSSPEAYSYDDEWRELPKGGATMPQSPGQAKDEPEAVMFLVNEVEEEKRERERREWLREFLAEEEILAEELIIVGEKINEEIEGVNGAVRDLIKDVEEQIQKTEDKCHNLYLKVANVNDDKEIGDIEEYLSNLKKDLDVTLDVPLDQVKRNLDKWVVPLRKELANLEEKTDTIERRPIAEARAMEREGRLILILGKVVCTVKPPPPPETTVSKEQQPRWKRKARVVICGNHAGQWHDPNDLFAAGASAEGLRLALALAVAMSWSVASTDVSAAFLQALWPTNRHTYGVLPPKVLLQAGLVEPEVVFIVKRALYGLRESPSLWAAHRTEVLKELVVDNGDGRIFLKQMMTDSELWMILEEPKNGGQPSLKGILVTYVDDILYLADTPVIEYLGMELKQEEGFFTLSQEAYITNLVRLHGLDVDVSAGLPCPKERIQEDDVVAEEENYSSSGGKQLAQWIIRKLADEAFTTNQEIFLQSCIPRIAAEAEIEKWMDEDDVPSRTTSRPTAPMNMGESRESTFGEIRPATPPLPERGQSVPISGQFDRERVVQDVLGLMTVQHLHDGLASEGLPVSGVKSDLTRRLGGQLGDEPPLAHLPTTRQLRYVLWTWRHFQLAGRTQILWVNLATRSAVSDWLARWNRG
ncbi:RE1 [Symbiodinium sp. KB8]|nr:RE1 [Symbiodinium sp. KB8]